MSRKVRRVPKNWEHPKNNYDNFDPLFDGLKFNFEFGEWKRIEQKWLEGFRPDYTKSEEEFIPLTDEEKSFSFEEWYGRCPTPDFYTEIREESECTHFMMYEEVTEGTPISPAFETFEQLAQWLSENESEDGNYEQWLRVCKGGYAPSFIISNGVIESGVKGLSDG